MDCSRYKSLALYCSTFLFKRGSSFIDAFMLLQTNSAASGPTSRNVLCGGGGASFMYLNSISNATLLYIAGGGGGATFTGGTSYVAGKATPRALLVHSRPLQ